MVNPIEYIPTVRLLTQLEKIDEITDRRELYRCHRVRCDLHTVKLQCRRYL